MTSKQDDPAHRGLIPYEIPSTSHQQLTTQTSTHQLFFPLPNMTKDQTMNTTPNKPTLDEWMACAPINTAPDATNNIIAMHNMNDHAIEHGLDHLSPEEMNTLRALHARGWAVCAFAPWEMNGAEQEQIEDAMAEAGWDAIDFYGENK